MTLEFWSTTSPVRYIVRDAFESVGLPYSGLHSFRHMHVRDAVKGGKTVEQVLAISENLGHSNILTIFRSNGRLSDERPKALIRGDD